MLIKMLLYPESRISYHWRYSIQSRSRKGIRQNGCALCDLCELSIDLFWFTVSIIASVCVCIRVMDTANVSCENALKIAANVFRRTGVTFNNLRASAVRVMGTKCHVQLPRIAHGQLDVGLGIIGVRTNFLREYARSAKTHSWACSRIWAVGWCRRHRSLSPVRHHKYHSSIVELLHFYEMSDHKWNIEPKRNASF